MEKREYPNVIEKREESEPKKRMIFCFDCGSFIGKVLQFTGVIELQCPKCKNNMRISSTKK